MPSLLVPNAQNEALRTVPAMTNTAGTIEVPLYAKPSQLATMLGCDTRVIYDLMDEPGFPAPFIHKGRYRFPIVEVEAFIKSRREEAPAQRAQTRAVKPVATKPAWKFKVAQ